MISSIKGEIKEKDEGSLVVEIGGLGFKVYTPQRVCAAVNLGDRISLYTYLVVREDNLSLYGFEDQDERELFQQLLKVNGVGPRIALAILSTLSVEKIYQAVIEEKPQLFNQVPGIGSKTSQKLVLMLHDKLKESSRVGILAGFRDIHMELLDALTGLGYSVVEAQAAIQSLSKDAPDDLEEQLRMALQYFSN
ncbi:MAG: Holliday junction branch migration protein RuvA [Pelolinea sp.]|nr:Holliday junction branch migration protein RuvA [Pelolinea sp.]